MITSPQWPQLRRGAPGPWPCGGVPFTTGCGPSAEYHHSRRPKRRAGRSSPSSWEQRLTDEFCLERRPPGLLRGRGVPRKFWKNGNGTGLDLPPTGPSAGCTAPWSRWSPRPTPATGFTLGNPGAQAGLAAQPGAHGFRTPPAFGISPAGKRALDLVTDHPMIPRQHLARWLGVSDGRPQPADPQPGTQTLGH